MRDENWPQSFICDKCGLESHVMVMPAEPVYSVVRKITADHEKHSPECDNPTERLRCIESKPKDEWYPDRIFLKRTHEDNGWQFGYYCYKPQDDSFFEYVRVPKGQRNGAVKAGTTTVG